MTNLLVGVKPAPVEDWRRWYNASENCRLHFSLSACLLQQWDQFIQGRILHSEPVSKQNKRINRWKINLFRTFKIRISRVTIKHKEKCALTKKNENEQKIDSRQTYKFSPHGTRRVKRRWWWCWTSPWVRRTRKIGHSQQPLSASISVRSTHTGLGI